MTLLVENSELDENIHLFSNKCAKEKELTSLEYFEFVSDLAENNWSFALGISMHLFTVWGLNYTLNDLQKVQFFDESLDRRDLFASLNEPSIYFTPLNRIDPNQFQIRATRCKNGFVVNGVKRFVSFEPNVRFLPVYCLVTNEKKENTIIALIIDKFSKGVNVINDWDSMSMRETQSNSILFENVFVPQQYLICNEQETLQKTKVFNYLFRLSICAVYYGMSKYVIKHIEKTINNKNIPHWKTKLSLLPNIQFSYSSALIKYETMYSQIIRYCGVIDAHLNDLDSANESIEMLSLITKQFVAENVEQLVNIAMKIEGMSSISNNNPLSKVYRDMKAIQFHPPQEDILKELIAKNKLGIITLKNRWC